MNAARPGFINSVNAAQGLTQSASRNGLPRLHGAGAVMPQARSLDVPRGYLGLNPKIRAIGARHVFSRTFIFGE